MYLLDRFLPRTGQRGKKMTDLQAKEQKKVVTSLTPGKGVLQKVKK